MTSRYICRECPSLLAKGSSSALHLKNRTEEIVIAGTDFEVRKTCRRCGAVNVLRHPSQP